MKKRRLKAVVGVVLSLCLVFSMSVPAFASFDFLSGVSSSPTVSKTYPEKQSIFKPTIDYLVLGDSMSNGYLLEGYKKADDVRLMSSAGWGNVNGGIYSDLFSQYLAGKGYNVNLYQYAANGVRPEEIRHFLDSSYPGDEWTKSFFGEKRIYAQMYGSKYENYRYGYTRASSDYRGAVKKADIISINLGTNTFCNYLMQKLQTWLGMKDRDYLKVNTADVVDKKYYSKYLKLKEAFADGLDLILGSKVENIGQTADYIIDDMTYMVLGFIKNYDAMINKMRELNPDALIAVMGLQNNVKCNKWSLQLGDTNIDLDLGTVCDIITGCINTLYKGQALLADNTIYVAPAECETFAVDVGKMSKSEFDPDRKMLENIIEETAWEAAETVFENGQKYNGVTLDYFKENGKSAAEKVLSNKKYLSRKELVSGGIYLGIRDAIIDAANDWNLTFDNVMMAYGGDPNETVVGYKNDFKTRMLLQNVKVLLDSQKIRQIVYDMFSKPEFSDALHLYLMVDPTGAGTHPNKASHEATYEALVKAYEKYRIAEKLEPVIKKTVTASVVIASLKYIKEKSGK